MTERRNILAALGLCVGGPLLMLLLVELNSNIFERMAIFYALAVPVALLAVRPPAKLFRFDFALAAWGVVLGALMYGAGWVGYALMRLVTPDFAATVLLLRQKFFEHTHVGRLHQMMIELNAACVSIHLMLSVTGHRHQQGR